MKSVNSVKTTNFTNRHVLDTKAKIARYGKTTWKQLILQENSANLIKKKKASKIQMISSPNVDLQKVTMLPRPEMFQSVIFT